MNFCLRVPRNAEMGHKNREYSKKKTIEDSYIAPALLGEQVHSSNVYASVRSEDRTKTFRADLLFDLLTHMHTRSSIHTHEDRHIHSDSSVKSPLIWNVFIIKYVHKDKAMILISMYIKIRKAIKVFINKYVHKDKKGPSFERTAKSQPLDSIMPSH